MAKRNISRDALQQCRDCRRGGEFKIRKKKQKTKKTPNKQTKKTLFDREETNVTKNIKARDNFLVDFLSFLSQYVLFPVQLKGLSSPGSWPTKKHTRTQK